MSIRILLALCALFINQSLIHANNEKPNVVLILVDDLGYGDLSSYGAKDMSTPHIDALMKAGTRFDQFYANCTVCTPTRASLLTGRYPDIVGTPGVIRQSKIRTWGHFRPNGPTLPALLKKGGYHTALVGKWHLGYESPNIPNDRGFDLFHGFLGDMMDDYYTHMRGGVNWMRHNENEIKAEGHATEVFTDWAIDYITERKEKANKPFFLYLAYNAPHFPIQPPKEWKEKVMKRESGIEEARGANVAFVEHLDHEIGRLIKSINDLGLSKDTLIIFSSDNGGSLKYAQSNLPLRGGKQDHWEGGICVPTCVVWPEKIPAGKRSIIPGMTMDFLPTICEIAGVKVEQEIDGQSLASVWLQGASGDPERTMIWVRREGNPKNQGRAYYAIRQGDWKLLQNNAFEPMQMVNLKKDPFEKNPKPAKGEIAKKLSVKLMEHIQEAGKIPWQKIDEDQ